MKIRKNNHIVGDYVADDFMLHNSQTNKYFLIKGVGVEVWKALGDETSLSDVISSLTSVYGSLSAEMIDEINAFIDMLKLRNLIHIDGQ